ncbi:MAG: tRNA (N6-isopentenyl adenosine(37)-C2)-methylthiotransferase MiaB, partial [candidate division Zixibacteria bacterium]|nr:tRNA (N6-isopentenyl adenosine(37)-C2)-methylthiotransferase MiaB [candidate division Zixibacteria bacterium]
REKAEQRVHAHIASSSALKKENPELKIAVIGCMAERVGKDIIDSNPDIDILLGPDYLSMLPDIIDNGFKDKAVFLSSDSDCQTSFKIKEDVKFRNRGISAFVAISKGCENYCSFCIVPYVRGKLRNKPYSDIIREIAFLVSAGVKEVTLLGQNVNSYEYDGVDFPALLRKSGEVNGIERIRFTTSHPKDVSEKLFVAMAETPQVCESLHLPMQAGSNRILKLMNRGYTIEQYKHSIKLAKKHIPELCLTTDLITGFPSETEEEFRMTIDAVTDIGFDAAFMFRYSKRPGTAAANLEDFPPDDVKIERLNRLISLQQRQAKEQNQTLINSTVEVMIDGVSKKNSNEFRGKDRGGRTVVVRNEDNLSTGDVINVKTIEAGSWTLIGERVT